jgi:hypothetical protein
MVARMSADVVHGENADVPPCARLKLVWPGKKIIIYYITISSSYEKCGQGHGNTSLLYFSNIHMDSTGKPPSIFCSSMKYHPAMFEHLWEAVSWITNMYSIHFKILVKYFETDGVYFIYQLGMEGTHLLHVSKNILWFGFIWSLYKRNKGRRCERLNKRQSCW